MKRLQEAVPQINAHLERPPMVKRYATLTVKHLAPTAALIDRAMPTDLLLSIA